MDEWLKLDPSQITGRNTERRTDADVEITYSISPYDVPEAVRGGFDAEVHRFVIEFRYLQEDPGLETVAGTDSQPIRLRVGKHTGRLRRIELDMVELKASSVALTVEIQRVLAALERSKRRPQSDNAKAAREVVDEYGERLLANAA